MTKLLERVSEMKLKLAAPSLIIFMMFSHISIILDQIGYKLDVSILAILATGIITILGYLVGSNTSNHKHEEIESTSSNTLPNEINLNINNND